MMVTEWALGRAARAGPVGVFRRFAPGSTVWRLTGWVPILICLLILSFYCAVGGWTVAYLAKAVSGSLLSSDTDFLKGEFDRFVSSPVAPLVTFGVFAGLTLGVVLGGVRRGIELLSRYLMPGLFLLMLVLIVRGLTLPGAVEGLVYFVRPDFGKISGGMVVDALGLSLFSLSLGIGIMLTYGSYIPERTRLVRSALWVISLSVGTCFLAGLMVLPPVFAFGFNPMEGPALTMITMPAVFAQMPAGAGFAVVFFVLLLFAALTSSVSILEVIVAFLIDEFGVGRRVAVVGTTAAFCVLGVAVSWSMGEGPLSGVLIFGKNIFGLFDYVTSNLLMPLCEIAVALFAGWVVWPVIEAQAGLAGRPRWVCRGVRFLLQVVVPVAIGVVMVGGWVR